MKKPDDFEAVESILHNAVNKHTGHLKRFVKLKLKLKLISRYSLMLSWYRKLEEHSCYGFNSGRYDLPILLPYLVNYASRKGIKVKALKRTNTYISLRIGNLVFKGIFSTSAQRHVTLIDTINLNSKCSLDKYMKQWGASAQKMIFPYEKFNSIEELRATTEFPSYESFYSTLRGQNVDRADYEAAASEYARRRALPHTSPEKYHNMADYLKVRAQRSQGGQSTF